MTRKILEKLKDDLTKQKEQFVLKYKNDFIKTYRNNFVSEPTLKGIIIPEPLPEDNPFGSEILKNIQENRANFIQMDNNNISHKHQVRDSDGEILSNPCTSDIANKYSDSYILNFVLRLKNQKHTTKDNSKGKNLDKVHDEIVDTLHSSKEVFKEPKTLEQFQEIADQSLKTAQARGVVVNEQNKMFNDFLAADNASSKKYEELNISAVNLSKNIIVDNGSSTNADVIYHSSLYNPSQNSFMNSIEINYAKILAKQFNAQVFVTGDVSIQDPELKEFIGDRRLIVFESVQTNFDYYMRVTTIYGEEVVIRCDLKNRPFERFDNQGEINAADDYTFMAVGDVTDSKLKDDKIVSYCNANLSNLKTRLLELQQKLIETNDPTNEKKLNYQIDLVDIQIKEFEIAKQTKNLHDITSFSGVKPLFHDFVSKKIEDSDVESFFEVKAQDIVD